ncbi:unnamed protein product [Prunus brigantina]
MVHLGFCSETVPSKINISVNNLSSEIPAAISLCSSLAFVDLSQIKADLGNSKRHLRAKSH